MKKIATTLTLLVLCIMSALAQSEHFKFMGIPITGTPIQMGEKLKAKGFVFKEKLDDEIRQYSGTFAGSKVLVDVISKSNVVWKILVEYPKCSSFNRLESDYEDMVEQYSKKYGEPSNHIEYFKDPYYKGDGYEMQALELEKCSYISVWYTDLGYIVIRLSQYGQLWISYEDKVGTEKKQEKQDQQIQNDI